MGPSAAVIRVQDGLWRPKQAADYSHSWTQAINIDNGAMLPIIHCIDTEHGNYFLTMEYGNFERDYMNVGRGIFFWDLIQITPDSSYI